MNKVQSKHAATSRISRKSSSAEERQHGPISDSDLTQLAKASRAHDWLRNSDEDIYNLKDGKPATWPAKRTNGAA